MSRAFGLAVMAVGLLSLMDAMMKAQTASFAAAQVSFLRYLFGSLGVLAVMVVARPPKPSVETIFANAWRAVLGVITSVSFVYALGRLPLAETMALSLLSPCYTVIFSALLLKEQVSRALVTALLVGFVGMLLIVAPNFGQGGGQPIQGVLAVMASTLTYSLSLVMLRSRATRDHPMTIVAVQNIGSVLLLAAVLPVAGPGAWVQPNGAELASFLGLGILGVAGHMLMVRAYGLAPAGRMAIADYTSLIFATIFGWMFFREIPAWTTIAGAALIVVASVAATRR